MATKVILKNPDTGLLKSAYYGFSWTTLIFGMFPALFRGDFITFIGAFAVFIILAVLSYGFLAFIASIAWAFMYNKYHARRLIERGYRLHPSDPNADAAKRSWNIA